VKIKLNYECKVQLYVKNHQGKSYCVMYGSKMSNVFETKSMLNCTNWKKCIAL